VSYIFRFVLSFRAGWVEKCLRRKIGSEKKNRFTNRVPSVVAQKVWETLLQTCGS